jgi:hypothetical protein
MQQDQRAVVLLEKRITLREWIGRAAATATAAAGLLAAAAGLLAAAFPFSQP